MRLKLPDIWQNIKNKLTAANITSQYEEEFLTYCFQKSIRRFKLFANAFYLSQILLVAFYFYYYKISSGNTVGFSFTALIAFSAVYIALIFFNTKLIDILGQKIEQNKYFLELAFIFFLIIAFVGQLINLYFDIQTSMGVYRLSIFLSAVAFLNISQTKKIWLTVSFMNLTTVLVCFGVMMDKQANLSILNFSVIILIILTATFISVYNKFSLTERFIGDKNMQESHDRLEEVNRQLHDMNDKLERLSVTDQLTQISNRRAFDEYIERMWNECRRLRKPMTIMMIDIDHFKAFNDFYGHVEGDDCLKAVTEAINRNFNRSTDMFARYGGEEFVAVLPFSEGESTLLLAEKIRASVEDLRIPNPKSKAIPFVTISIGLASRIPNQISEQLQNPEWIVALADLALYEAKNSGRNRIVANVADDKADEYLALGVPHMRLPGPGEDLEKLQVIVQAAMISVFSIDLIAGSIEFSKEIIAYIGDDNYKFDRYQDFFNYVYEDDRAILEKTMQDLFSHSLDTTNPVLFRLSCGEDNYSWVSLSIRYMYDNSFNVISAVGSISDYSKQTYEHEINRLMAQGSSNYLYHYNYESNCAGFSERFMEDFGIDSPIVKNAAEFFYSLIYEDDKNLFLKEYRKLKKTGSQIMECAVRVHSPSKGIVWLNCRGMMARNYKGKPYMLAGSLTDITECVKTGEVNRLIIDSCADCVYVWDLKTDICQFSSKIKEIIDVQELSLEQASKKWQELIVPEDRKAIAGFFKKIMEYNSDTHKSECRITGSGGKPIYIDLRGKCSLDESGNPDKIAGSIMLR